MFFVPLYSIIGSIMMKKIIYILILSIGFQYFFLETTQGQNVLSLDNSYLHYDGAFYTEVTPTLVTFNRHKQEVYNNPESGIYGSWIQQWVITQTGVRIRFKTKSPKIKITFQERAGGGKITSAPTNGFGVFADSVFIASYSTLSFTIQNPKPGSSTFFEVTLPDMWAVDLIEMELEDAYVLDDPGVLKKPVYVAIGDSKTHGMGQYVSSAKTYPFLLASKMKWDLYNIAVASAITGWAMALNVKGQQVDNITIEIGYNDWNNITDPLSVRQTQYEKLIDSLRAYLPDAKIYCITPLATASVSAKAPYTLDEFRNMIKTIVSYRKQMDSKLFFISGPAISNISMLASNDDVHLSEEGASVLANNLKEVINDPNSSFATDQLQNIVVINYISNLQIDVVVQENGYYTFEIFSPEGRRTCSIKEIYLEKGSNQIIGKTPDLISGLVYIVKAQKGNFKKTSLVIVE